MKTIKKWNSTQAELFAVANFSWDTCAQYIDQFASVKPKYTPDYVAAQKAEIARVAALPNRSERSSNQEKEHLLLREALGTCLSTWKKLQSMIMETWLGEEADLNLKQAGSLLYPEAIKRRWEVTLTLMQNGSNFIAEHREALQKDRVMSPEFPEEFQRVMADYQEKFKRYLEMVKQNGLLTGEKQRACSAIYTQLTAMYSDAKIIFKGNARMTKLFTFTSILKKVGGVDTAGIKGSLVHALPLAVLPPGLGVRIVETGELVLTDASGRFQFSQLAAGLYHVEVEAEGFEKLRLGPIEVKTGAYSLVKGVLQHTPPPAL